MVLPRHTADRALAQHGDEVTDASASLFALSIVRVRLCMENSPLRSSSTPSTESDTVVSNFVQVFQTPLDGVPVQFTGAVQELADHTHEVSKVRSCIRHEIHKTPNYLSVRLTGRHGLLFVCLGTVLCRSR